MRKLSLAVLVIALGLSSVASAAPTKTTYKAVVRAYDRANARAPLAERKSTYVKLKGQALEDYQFERDAGWRPTVIRLPRSNAMGKKTFLIYTPWERGTWYQVYDAKTHRNVASGTENDVSPRIRWSRP